MTSSVRPGESRRTGLSTRVAIGTLLAAVLAGCGAENTGTLSLFAPVRQPHGNDQKDAQSPGTGGATSDARPPVNDPCADGGCATECRVDGDCHSGSASRCEGASGRCVECLTTPDCAGDDRPLCDEARHQCAECLADVDCTDQSKPGCFAPTGRCEECSTDAHCSDGKRCDATDGHCR